MNRRLVLLAGLFACLLALAGGASAGSAAALKASAIDNLATAATIKANRSYDIVNAEEATNQAGEPDHECANPTGNGVWFKFKVEHAIDVVLTTLNDTISFLPVTDTVLSVYEYDPAQVLTWANLHTIGCNDDLVSLTVLWSRLAFTAQPGRVYFVKLSSFGANTVHKGSAYRLNVWIDNLLSNGDFDGAEQAATPDEAILPWKLRGAGVVDDVISCDYLPGGPCALIIQNVFGYPTTTLRQTISALKGLRINPGSALVLSGQLDVGVGDHTINARVIVKYTDGTTDKHSTALSVNKEAGNPEPYSIETQPLIVTKPVAKIKVIVRFTQSTYDHLIVNSFRLAVNPQDLNIGLSGVLPLPAALK